MQHSYGEELLIGLDLFKNKQYQFITDLPGGERHQKQYEALCLLTDDETVELLYGGAAGGAKSWTGCAWLHFMCLLYPGTRWFIGREELKRLKETTLETFFMVAGYYGAVRDVDYKYREQGGYIHYANGSRIYLLELKYKPSDPMYERFGSAEYTGGWIEEGGEIHFKAFDVLKSRIGRKHNDKYGLLRKLFVTCNPKKNWIYTYFYKPFTKGELPKYKKFLKALLGDNPHRESGYEESLLSISDKVTKERLLLGNFEYDDDPATLCEYDAIQDIFSNDFVKGDGKTYISADLAMQGRDRFVAGVWNGLLCDLTKGLDESKSTGKGIEESLKALMVKHNVPRSQTVADSDGLGAYLVSYLNGIKEFHGGATAIDAKEYANLKSECGYKLAEMVNKRMIKVICNQEQQERIARELGVLKSMDVDGDEKRKRIISKKDMKALLSYSPDYLDMLIMRMYFMVQKPKVKAFAR